MNDLSHLTVLHVASGDLWAGAEVQLYTLTNALQRMPGVRVSVVLLNHGALEQKLLEIGIKVIVLDESKLNGVKILIELIRIIRVHRPDVIHTHRIKENILGSIAGLFAGRTPSIRTAHGAPEHHPSWLHFPKRLIIFMDWFCGQFLQKKIIAVSEDLAEILKKNFPSNRIHIIENGIDLQYISKRTNTERAITVTGRQTSRIGIAGRLAPIKRIDLFVETARYILDHFPDLNVSFHIFGDGPLRHELEQLNIKLETDDTVCFEGHCEDINEKLQTIDVLLMTSDHEGLPMILLEAMALQTPIIAHAVGGIPHLLEQGSCGVLVYEQKASVYAEEIYRLAKSPNVLSELSKNAFNRVRTCYSAARNARSYLSLYSEITSGRLTPKSDQPQYH